jgi:hypothetical protein
MMNASLGWHAIEMSGTVLDFFLPDTLEKSANERLEGLSWFRFSL